ncbi:hypothetical protein ACFX2I_016884 [Malus domestica]
MDTSTALEASSSSSPSSSSSTTSSSSPYDVFLSFGEDTRKTFTDHLYWTMKDAGIDFFMEENESIRRGENISDKVKQIIEGSKVSVIVFSSTYADSIWCLEELVQIMECRRTLKQMVLPIFYDLSPSDVIGTFVLAFQKHRERFHEDTDIQEKLRRWTDALTAAAGLTVWTEALTAAAGLTVRVFRTTNGYEGMFIREIIAEITVGIAFPELQRLDSPELEDIDSTEHTDIASSVSSANSPFSLETLKKKRHEPDRSDSTSRKFSETWKVRVPVDILPDEYSWRKYGQRDILNSPYPRSYYRCTYRDTHGCGATKQVERDRDDPEMLTVTYRGVHVCTVAELGFAERRDEIQNSGLEQLQRGLLQKPKRFIQAPQPFHQLQMLTPHHQQLMLQNMTSLSAANDESRRPRMLLNPGLGKDGLANSVGDVVPNIGSPLQAGVPILPRGDTDMLIKLKMPQLHQQQLQQQKLQLQKLQLQQLQHHAVSNQRSQNSKLNPHQQDKMGGAGSIAMDGSMSNSFRGSDQVDTDRSVGRCMDVSKGFTFTEVISIRACSSKVSSCHFSSDGKFLAIGGYDKKAVLWYTDTLKLKSTLEEHSALITDVRFSPSMPLLATSSFDKTVRVWDADNPSYSLRTFMGHSASVMSLDFHPNKDDLICSCDGDGQICYWSINNGCCSCVSKGGTAQIRFQPRLGRFLAAAAENVVSILDVETQTCRHSLQGHTKPIHSVCWDPSGEFLASVSEDSIRVWTLGAGGEGECVHELRCNGNKFHSCVFHPTYTSLLVIGCYQTLELWNMTENKSMILPAHEGLIASLAVSTVTGLIASASHDKFVKIWK